MKLTGHILIVDDEAHVRLFLSLIVRSLGTVEIHGAPNGLEALAAYRALPCAPSLILLDVNMPGIDGIETLRLLRAAGATCPIVMMTSLATRQRVEEAIVAGADHYIRKDTPRDDIVIQLQNVLDDASDSLPAPERLQAPRLPPTSP
jgi:CheY-like chemotaxis protein